MNMHWLKAQELSELAEAILGEAWTEQRKAEMVAKFTERGFTSVDHRVIGDYDLILWKCTKAGASLGTYSVSINSGQHDPGDFRTQSTKQAGKTTAALSGVINALIEWVELYGKILIASVDYRKLKHYRSILSRYFLIANYDDNSPDNLFYIMSR